MRSIVPMFPLPDYFLYPGTVAPLHVFEPRYRQMVADLLDGPGRLVIASIPKRQPRPAGEGAPPVFPIGCLVEIVRHEKLPDGRYMIVVAGLKRVRIEEAPSDRLYRQARIQPLESIECDGEAIADLRPQLEAAIRERAGRRVELDDDLPIGSLADLLVHCLELSPEKHEEMISELDALRRAELALAWHAEVL